MKTTRGHWLVGFWLTATLTASLTTNAVEPLDEDALGGLHLEGLDPPAAGDVRSPVGSDVNTTTTKLTEKNLEQKATRTGEPDTTTAPGTTPTVSRDLTAISNTALTGRNADVAVRKNLSADQSTNEQLEDGTAVIRLRNQVQSISVENGQFYGAPANRGSFGLENINANTEIRIQQR